MASRVRSVDWAASARAALDEVLECISLDSAQAAADVLEEVLIVGASLATLADRGRIVLESNDPAIRETCVIRYRLIYEVQEERVVVIAFVYGARDFAALRSSQS